MCKESQLENIYLYIVLYHSIPECFTFMKNKNINGSYLHCPQDKIHTYKIPDNLVPMTFPSLCPGIHASDHLTFSRMCPAFSPSCIASTHEYFSVLRCKNRDLLGRGNFYSSYKNKIRTILYGRKTLYTKFKDEYKLGKEIFAA